MKMSGGYFFLSNFFPSPFTVGGKLFPTVEHFYQAMKTTDEKQRHWIISSPTPRIAKRRGRKVTLRPDWESIKIDVMRFALRKKFELPHMMDRLRMVDCTIVEDNTWGDKFWGVCDGEGENWLGKLLMELRDSDVGKNPS